MAALPDFTIDEIGIFLNELYSAWKPRAERSFNMSDVGVGANDGVLYYNYTGFVDVEGAGTDTNGLSFPRQLLVDSALEYLGEVLGIEFIPTTSQGDHVDIYFSDHVSTAYAGTEMFSAGNGALNHRYIDHAWVNVPLNWSGGSSAINDYTYHTFLHEILHALGLGHAGFYDDEVPNFVTDDNDPLYGSGSNYYLNDSWQMSVMSYLDQLDNPTINADFNFLITPMAGDFQALRKHYGSDAFTGDTIYGFNTNISPLDNFVLANLADLADETAFTIIDDGGLDMLDFSGYAANQFIDIRIAEGTSTTGTVSDIGGQIGNMTLAVGTVIESVSGGFGSDIILGNRVDNSLLGAEGDDFIDGGGGVDIAVYLYDSTEYTLTDNLDGSFTIAHVGLGLIREGADTLVSVEYASFADGVFQIVPDLGPDLIADALLLSTTLWESGDLIDVVWDIVNIGEAPAASSASRLYISDDPTITREDIVLLEDPGSPPLAPGEFDVEGEPNLFVVPGGLAPGTYYVGVIADDDREVNESSEINNVSNVIEVVIDGPPPGGDVLGSDQSEQLSGSVGDDLFLAFGGSDRIIGGGGSDLVDGGLGNDTVFYQGIRDGFAHDLLQNGEIIVDKPNGGTDTLDSVERIEFLDGDLVYDLTSDNTGFGYRIYQASFGRTPDEDGVRFWIGVLYSFDQQGWTDYEKEQFLASQFIQSDEFKALYGADPTNFEYIDAMYQNVLFRLPDQGGYDFWVGGMVNDGLTREDILIAFTKSDENVDNVSANLDDGVWVV